MIQNLGCSSNECTEHPRCTAKEPGKQIGVPIAIMQLCSRSATRDFRVRVWQSFMWQSFMSGAKKYTKPAPRAPLHRPVYHHQYRTVVQGPQYAWLPAATARHAGAVPTRQDSTSALLVRHWCSAPLPPLAAAAAAPLALRRACSRTAGGHCCARYLPLSLPRWERAGTCGPWGPTWASGRCCEPVCGARHPRPPLQLPRLGCTCPAGP